MKKFQANVKSIFDPTSETIIDKKIHAEQILYIEINNIVTGTYQTRKYFNDESLVELSDSIKEHRILNPITVKLTKNNTYELIAGERRWRAAKLAKISYLPAIVINLSHQQTMVLGLIENIQRDQLNPIEEAEAFNRLIKEFKLTHEEISIKVGKPRSTISNFLRLLNLEKSVQNKLKMNKLSLGHAKLLTTLDGATQRYYENKIVEEKLAVRKLEKLIIDGRHKLKKPEKVIVYKKLEGHLYYEKKIAKSFQTHVKLNVKKSDYCVELKFSTKEKLDTFVKKHCSSDIVG